jgi:hypothetical protein
MKMTSVSLEKLKGVSRDFSANEGQSSRPTRTVRGNVLKGKIESSGESREWEAEPAKNRKLRPNRLMERSHSFSGDYSAGRLA